VGRGDSRAAIGCQNDNDVIGIVAARPFAKLNSASTIPTLAKLIAYQPAPS
jgi:hypothetical protein